MSHLSDTTRSRVLQRRLPTITAQSATDLGDQALRTRQEVVGERLRLQRDRRRCRVLAQTDVLASPPLKSSPACVASDDHDHALVLIDLAQPVDGQGHRQRARLDLASRVLDETEAACTGVDQGQSPVRDIHCGAVGKPGRRISRRRPRSEHGGLRSHSRRRRVRTRFPAQRPGWGGSAACFP